MTCDDDCCNESRHYCDFPHTNVSSGRLFVCTECNQRYEAVTTQVAYANAPRILRNLKNVKIVWRRLK